MAEVQDEENHEGSARSLTSLVLLNRELCG
nr:MAG TPA: hypothetical protein [Caudoviricetes sp.]